MDQANLSKHSLNVIRRHLHIVAMLMNEKENWNAEKIAAFLSPETASDSGVDGKTIRLDLKKNIPQTLGIDIETRKGARRVTIAADLKDEDLLNLLMMYADFIVHDSSRTDAFNRLILRQKNLSLWLLMRIHFASLTKNRVQFDYIANDMKKRKVKMNPYYIINRSNSLYLIGKREKDDTIGPYVFDRIENLNVLGESFEDSIPSADELFRHSHGAFIWNWSDATDITIRYNLNLENSMIDEFSHLNPEIKRFAGHFEMRFLVFDYESVCRQLFFYGSDVVIVSPPEVREYMVEMLEKSISVYRK